MAVVTQWKIKPVIDAPREGVWLGPGRPSGDGIWLGTLAEAVIGKQPAVWLGSSKEQVVAVVGKRGSGKSFTLGVLIEGFCSGEKSAVGVQEHPRAVMVFDPLDIYWTTRFPVGPSANAEAQRHYEMARANGLGGIEPKVEAWVPGTSNRRETDPDWFQTLQISVPSMGLEEWELLLETNVMSEPMGQALTDVLNLVRDSGYRLQGDPVKERVDFDLVDLSSATQADELEGLYHPETLRALRQRLVAFEATGLFSRDGTTIGELLIPGVATIILLERLPQSYREAVIAVFLRMLINARGKAAFTEKRLALDPNLTADERSEFEAASAIHVPRTVVVLDEAQSFLSPGARSPSRELFVRLVKEGRNMGLSAIIATQQPSAIDRRILSQVETFVSHQLVTDSDIRAVSENLKSALPQSVQFGTQSLDSNELIRQLPPGACLVSAADMNTSIRRSMVVAIRPRSSVHGGIEL